VSSDIRDEEEKKDDVDYCRFGIIEGTGVDVSVKANGGVWDEDVKDGVTVNSYEEDGDREENFWVREGGKEGACGAGFW
jgi:hypothetical protein